MSIIKARVLTVVHAVLLHHKATVCPVTSSPATLPFLARPSLRASDAFRKPLLHTIFPLPAKLRFPHDLIQIPALPLELKLLWRHHSVSHVTCSIFLHTTEVLSLISSAIDMGFRVRNTGVRILSLPLLWSWTNHILILLRLHFLIRKNELLYSSKGITCQISEFNALFQQKATFIRTRILQVWICTSSPRAVPRIGLINIFWREGREERERETKREGRREDNYVVSQCQFMITYIHFSTKMTLKCFYKRIYV